MDLVSQLSLVLDHSVHVFLSGKDLGRQITLGQVEYWLILVTFMGSEISRTIAQFDIRDEVFAIDYHMDSEVGRNVTADEAQFLDLITLAIEIAEIRGVDWLLQIETVFLVGDTAIS